MYTPRSHKNQRRSSPTTGNLSKDISSKKKTLSNGIKREQNLTFFYQKKWQLQKIAKFLIVCSVLLSIFGLFSWVSYKLLLKSDIFGVYTITLEGNENISKKRILALSGIVKGSSLLLHDPEIIESKIKKHNWIENAKVTKHFPSTINIKVWTHKPVALVNLELKTENKLYYIDKNGSIFTAASGFEDIDFPVITGMVTTREIKTMRLEKKSPADQALQFLKIAAQGNAVLPIQAISEIHISKDKGLIVYLAENPFPIYIGLNKVNESYYRLVKILRQLYQRKKITDIAKIQLDYTENKVLVTMVQQ